jgi:predicted Zn finger-like uncharacterized protein
MSLATTCPQCKTSFKVVPDQLKLRRGLVRCGICRHVFSGVDFLKYLEEPGGTPAVISETLRQPADPSLTASDGANRGLHVDRDIPEPSPAEPVPHDRATVEPHAVDANAIGQESATHDALDASTLDTATLDTATFDTATFDTATLDTATLDTATFDTATLDTGEFETPVRDTRSSGVTDTSTGFEAAPVDDAGERTVQPRSSSFGTTTANSVGHAAPVPVGADATDSPEEDAVDFFSTNERAGGFATRSAVFAAMAALVLGVALALQLAIGARDWLAAAVPGLRPALVAALAPIGLSIHPPRQLGALTIESFELQSAGDSGLLAMNALLRNAVDHPVRWPAMELSLTDGSGAVVVRKVLLPADYLAGASRGETDGVAANAEWPVRVALQPQGVEPTAYSVKLFYP